MRKVLLAVVALAAIAVGVVVWMSSPDSSETERLRTQVRAQEQLIANLQRQLGWKNSNVRENSEAYKKDVAERFHTLFYNSQGWELNRWFGIKTQQNPNDVWIIQEIIAETKPDWIVETGTLKGGSALLWASILEHVNPAGRVLTVDIEDQSAEARTHPLAKSRIDFLVGSSTAPEIIGKIKERVGSGRAMVILDSDHSAKHVLRELELYSPLVQVNDYLVVQDSNVNGNPVQPEHGPGPGEAITEFLAKNPNFVQDRSRERLLFTMHPGGWLKRVR